ncbi:hypothetical protein KCU81_g790, partial [Aureobasidium melanogenum]
MLAIQAGNATSDSEDLIMIPSRTFHNYLRFFKTIKVLFVLRVWPEHVLHYVAKHNKDSTGFEVRQENGADPTGDQDGDGDGDDEDEEEKEEEDNNDGDGDDEDDDVEDEDIQDADEWPYHLGLPTRSIGTSSLIQAWESVCSF